MQKNPLRAPKNSSRHAEIPRSPCRTSASAGPHPAVAVRAADAARRGKANASKQRMAEAMGIHLAALTHWRCGRSSCRHCGSVRSGSHCAAGHALARMRARWAHLGNTAAQWARPFPMRIAVRTAIAVSRTACRATSWRCCRSRRRGPAHRPAAPSLLRRSLRASWQSRWRRGAPCRPSCGHRTGS